MPADRRVQEQCIHEREHGGLKQQGRQESAEHRHVLGSVELEGLALQQFRILLVLLLQGLKPRCDTAATPLGFHLGGRHRNEHRPHQHGEKHDGDSRRRGSDKRMNERGEELDEPVGALEERGDRGKRKDVHGRSPSI